MNPIERAARGIDGFQRRHPVVAFPYAVLKKFGDDEGGRLAALIAYYGFFSLFPLLLVLVSVLGFVLAGHPGLRNDVIDSAFAQFPVIGRSLRAQAHVDRLQGNVVGIVVGAVTALWAGLGVAQSAEVALNTVWDVPREQWPNFVFRRVRAVLMLLLLGFVVIASTFVTGAGSSGWFGHAVLGWLVGFVLNLVLFTLAYRVLTATDLRWRDVLPGAVAAAVAWTALQAVGGYYVTHQLDSASDVYGTFALVIALLVWISLGAQVALFCAEINVVWDRGLWPRSLVQPPLAEGDEEVYRGIVERARMRPEVAVDVWFTDNQEKGAGGRSGAELPDEETGSEAASESEGSDAAPEAERA